MKATEFTKQRLDPKCWTGKKIGTPKTKVKGGVRVNNCVPIEEDETGNVDDADSWQSQQADARRSAETSKMSQQDATAGGLAEGAGQQLSVHQLAAISDEALDKAYGYGRSTPGNTFGWQANLKSAQFAKQMIDKGLTDIEAISDAIHKGWNVTAQAFVQNPEQFDDTAKLQAAGKLEAKLQQRAQLMKQNYAQLPDEEKEKDRVVARALLQAIRGQQGVTEGTEQEILFYAKIPDGSRVYARVKDEEQWAWLQQQYRGSEIKSFDFRRPDILDWLEARGINLRKFAPGMVQTMYPGSRGLNEFAPGAGDEGGGEDPYKYPKPKRYARSADYFGQFEADHFDREKFDDATGVFKGYWGQTPIAYFKFADPARTSGDDPGMGWYYEPESISRGNDASAAPAVDRSDERKQQELGMIDAFLKSGNRPNPDSQIGRLMKRHGMTEAAHTTNFNDDDWYEINPDTETIVSQRGPQAYRLPFGQRQIKLPNGNIVVRGMRAKHMRLNTGLGQSTKQ